MTFWNNEGPEKGRVVARYSSLIAYLHIIVTMNTTTETLKKRRVSIYYPL